MAETYYLKALDNWGWDHAETAENLALAHSYDTENPGILCLTAVVHWRLLNHPAEAETILHRAIALEPESTCAYEILAELYIRENRLTQAERILRHLEGKSPRTFLLWSMAIILERRFAFDLARDFLKNARLESADDEVRQFLLKELNRIKAKSKEYSKLRKTRVSAKQ